jgi:RND family efflux transporter MFP subunit
LRIGQAEAGVAQARAALAGAATARGYAAIRSQVDGVVTQRAISPGVLVNPGQAILKIAQIQPIRLQANVAEADLARVRVGARVTLRRQNETGSGVVARVTSIAPAVDPVARTGVVEAVVPNREARFLPGHYVVMEIETGQQSSVLRVPSRAIRWRTSPSGGVLSTRATPFLFVAEPLADRAGEYAVREASVQAGLSDGNLTEILSGLKEGEQVVVAGHQYLKTGDTVSASPASPPHAHAAPKRYTCPMHPEIVRGRPGTCPKCGMELVPIEGDGHE